MTTLEHDAAPRSIDPPVVTTGLIDVDIHPAPRDGALLRYLPQRWRDHLAEYGSRTTTGLQSITEYPPMYAAAMRADSWPDSGFPGSDLSLIQKQLLDMYDIQLGVLQAFVPAAQLLNQEQAAAMCRAINDWQLEELVYPEPRLRAAIPVPSETPEYAVTEIERIGTDPGVVAVLMMSKSMQPLGSRRYWPIYQAATDLELPIQIHLSQGGGHANTGTGWTSYHPEYHTGHTQSFQSQLISFILSGTFDRFPELKIIFVEGNVVHFGAVAQRLDYHWSTLRSEVPDLQRRPSEYLADHIFASTQPMDEPDDPAHLVEMIEEFGAGNVLFASDYPHFDFDSPETAFPRSFPSELRDKIVRSNGQRVFGLESEG